MPPTPVDDEPVNGSVSVVGAIVTVVGAIVTVVLTTVVGETDVFEFRKVHRSRLPAS